MGQRKANEINSRYNTGANTPQGQDPKDKQHPVDKARKDTADKVHNIVEKK